MNIIACFFVIEENEFTFKRDENEMVRRRSFSNGQEISAFFVVRKKNRQNWNRRKLNMMKGFKQTIWHALCGCTCTLATWQRSQPFEPVSWTHKLIMKFYTKVTPFHFDKIFFWIETPTMGLTEVFRNYHTFTLPASKMLFEWTGRKSRERQKNIILYLIVSNYTFHVNAIRWVKKRVS